jgi:hypothetical protein
MYTRKGLRALATRNPIATYEAATNRQTSYEVDRVYGIQQIFNCRIGNTAVHAASMSCQFSLHELEEQLGLELLNHLPAASQFHVFTKPITLASKWRIQTYSMVPGDSATYTCYMDEVSPNMEHKCNFNISPSEARGSSVIKLEGLTILLERLIFVTRCINAAEASHTVVSLKVFLDVSPSMTSPYEAHYTGKTEDHTIQRLLASYTSHGVRVVCLGISFGFYSCRIYGVVVVEQRSAWQWLGLCFWEIFNDRSRPTISSLLQLDTLFVQSAGLSWQYFCGLYGTAST